MQKFTKSSPYIPLRTPRGGGLHQPLRELKCTLDKQTGEWTPCYSSTLTAALKVMVDSIGPRADLGADTQKFYGFLNEQLFP